MSLVENLISQISTNGLSGISKPLGFDMEDDTFAKLLNKQLNQDAPAQTYSIGNMGAPAGLIIEPFEQNGLAEIPQDQPESIGETNLTKDEYINQPIEFKDIDMGDYFSNLLKTSSDNNSDFMNLAKKHATNAYNVFSKNFVEDMTDFVNDIAASL